MKPKYAALLAAVLGLFILQAWIGFGLAYRLTPIIQTSLWACIAATGLGLLAAFTRRPRLGLAAFAVTAMILVWHQIYWDQGLSESHQEDAEQTRAENAALLSQALAQAPCTNGDVAILSKETNLDPNFSGLTLQIVPRNRAEKPDILVSASGDYRPPDDADVKRYRAEHHTDCRSPEYPSLDSMMARVTKHYWAERHKYVR